MQVSPVLGIMVGVFGVLFALFEFARTEPRIPWLIAWTVMPAAGITIVLHVMGPNRPLVVVFIGACLGTGGAYFALLRTKLFERQLELLRQTFKLP